MKGYAFMSKRILRRYLYLDGNTVDDYLSQVDGGVIEGSYTSKETSSGSKEGGVSGNFVIGVSGKLTTDSSTEVT